MSGRAQVDGGPIDLCRVPAVDLPTHLGAVHRAGPVGDHVALRCPGRGPTPSWPAPGPPSGDDVTNLEAPEDDDLGARGWWPGLDDLLEGAGLTPVAAPRHRRGNDVDEVVAEVRRRRSLPDTVGPGMALLVCGLNPSEHAADAGIGFVTASNRFWPAALDAGLVSRDRDPVHALAAHGVGMTDLVKRATPRADALTVAEYRSGAARLARLCRWLAPAVVAFVGLAGWRAAVDRRATAGPQPRRLGGAPVYVLPSTSGLNARTSRDELADHLVAAHRLATTHRLEP